MSELKRYSCTVLVDASTGFNVEAISPEDAAEKAENLAAESGATSICHQCSANLEIGDFCGVMVYDEDLGEQVLDTTYGAEQIARLIHKLDALAADRDEGLALLRKARAWIEAARDGVLNPIARDFDGVVGFNAEGLGQQSAQLLDTIDQALARPGCANRRKQS